MDEQTSYLTSRDGCKLFLRRWIPAASPPRAAVLVVHGMAEHSGRYVHFAENLCEAGIEVWAFDLRGHGKTADLTINSAAIGGLFGHCADRKTFSKLLTDIDTVAAAIEKALHGIPLFLLGHSFGSFLAQGSIAFGKRKLSGCMLSGTRGPGGAAVNAGAAFLNVWSFFRGRRHLSRFVSHLVMGGHNKPFSPSRTPVDWLSRDTEFVDSYLTDPLCGGLNSAGFFCDMLRILQKIHTGSAIAKIPKKLPVYIFSGSSDPVGLMGKSVTNLVEKYKQEGIADLEFVLYPNARHETLNETNRGEVIANLIDWMKRHGA
ncbi:MAG: lysophospholipase [Spirochaetaceae bacterium]|nr:lysophospholipase [Spirochaetaceae bacterium]